MENTDTTPRTSFSKTPRSSISRTSFKRTSRRSSGKSLQGSTSTWSDAETSIINQQWSPILGGSGYSSRTSVSRSRSSMSRSSIGRSPTVSNIQQDDVVPVDNSVENSGIAIFCQFSIFSVVVTKHNLRFHHYIYGAIFSYFLILCMPQEYVKIKDF